MKIQTIGKMLIVVGLVVLLYAWNMPVSIGYSGVINLHLINQKQNTLILGGLLFLSGIVLFAAFKVKQTKEEEKLDEEVNEAIKEKTVEKLTSSHRAVKIQLGRILGAEEEPVDARRDHPVARTMTGLYVGLCFSMIIGEIFEYIYLVGFALSIWLAFRPRAAWLVISKMNIANVVLLSVSIAILYIQDIVSVYSYNRNSILGLTLLIPISLVLWIYANKRMKPKS